MAVTRVWQNLGAHIYRQPAFMSNTRFGVRLPPTGPIVAPGKCVGARKLVGRVVAPPRLAGARGGGRALSVRVLFWDPPS